MSDLRSRDVIKQGTKWGTTFLVLFAILSIIGGGLALFTNVLSRPATTAVGVMNLVMNPDDALRHYRWFRDTHNQLEAMQANIAIAKTAATSGPEDRRSARVVELTGLQQACNQLVGQYNSRAESLDARLFMDPTQFLTGLVDGQRPRPLPARFEFSTCS